MTNTTVKRGTPNQGAKRGTDTRDIQASVSATAKDAQTQAYYAAIAADKAFQLALEKQYGADAVAMRYLGKYSAETQVARDAFLLASDALAAAIKAMREVSNG